MAGTKKYAGLPDLDDAGTELYQTPGLTDDASTVQTETIRTESPTPSEQGNDHFDRSKFDRDEARRRFEPAVVDARNVNFSYAVGGSRKSYTSKHRRRRRTQRKGVDEYVDVSDVSDSEREETLGQRLARLKREAEELRLEIERREKEDGEFQDSFEHQQGGHEHEDNETDLSRGVDDLAQILNGLQTSTRPKHESVEQEFSRRLGAENLSRKEPSQPKSNASQDITSPTAISEITSFSDRLTAIESALGLSTFSQESNPTAILPTLETLTNQLNLLHSTITPKPTPSASSPTVTTTNTNLTPQMPHLDLLQSRLHILHQSASQVLASRKSAQTALTELETVRLRNIRTTDHLSRYQTLALRRVNRSAVSQPTIGGSPTSSDSEEPSSKQLPAASTTTAREPRRSTVISDARERLEITDEIMTPLFLEDQAEKIKALYNVLPTIQNLQPLLPVVLDRLRTLSVVHVGAAAARTDMDEVEGRLREWESELAKWKDAVEGVEAGIVELKGSMKENVEVVGVMVRGVEERIGRLEGVE